MPLVRITISPDDSLQAWACGIPRNVPEHLLHVERMGLLLDYLYEDMGGPYTVEVIEADGASRTGTIDLNNVAGHNTPQDTGATPPPLIESSPVDPSWGPPDEKDRWTPDQTPHRPARHALPADAPEPDYQDTSQPTEPPALASDGMVSVRATGLWAAERVCLGLVVTESRADQSGQVTFLVPRTVVASLPVGEVLVYGQASHTTTLELPLLDR